MDFTKDFLIRVSVNLSDLSSKTKLRKIKMALTKKKKEELVSEFAEKIKNKKAIVFVDFSGIPVDEINDLRSKLKEQGALMRVVKLNLFAIAAEKAGVKVDINDLAGHPVAFIFSDDEISAPKTVYEFSKSNNNLEILGGILEGRKIALEEVKSLAMMPSREELYAKLVGSLASPLRGMVGVLSGNLRGLVNVINQYAESKE